MRRRWNCWNQHFATAANGNCSSSSSGQAGGGGGSLPFCCWKVHIVTAVLLLTAVNVYLLIQLVACGNGRLLPHNAMPPTTGNSAVVVGASASKLTAAVTAGTTGRRDASSQFVIRDHFVSGDRFEATAIEHGVCLATQSSLDRLLRSFPQAADHWRGAASVSLFLEGAQEASLFVSVVRHLRRCHAQFWSDVSFHVVVAASDADVLSPLLRLKDVDVDDESFSTDAFAQLERSINCSNTSPSKAFAWILGDSSNGGSNDGRDRTMKLFPLSSASSSPTPLWTLRASTSVSQLRAKWLSSALRGGKYPYPQNLMRNVARKGCPAPFVLLLDVDVIPSLNMAQSLSAFLLNLEEKRKKNNNMKSLKCAFVVPTYELDERSAFPRNKSQLLQLVADGRAQPFHHKAFRYNQYASNLTRWEQPTTTADAAGGGGGGGGGRPATSEDVVVVSHDVTNYEFFYEPFYAARDDAPPHDERFVGYGFTRNTQVYEMALSDWSFHVLSPIFTIHWGLQLKQQRRLPAWRKRQMEKNRQLFDGTIHHELKVKYSNATLLHNNNKDSSPSAAAMPSSLAAIKAAGDGSGIGRWRGVKSRPSPVNG